MKELSVLVVDDNPIQLTVMERQLSKYGISNIITCDNGEEALRAVSESQFDIIFSDIVMPEMEGITLIRSLDNMGYKGALAIASGAGASIVSSLSYMSQKLRFSNVYGLNKPISDSLLKDIFEKESHIKTVSTKQKMKQVNIDELTIALSENQFKNYYQPQTDYSTGAIVGLEALARWNHPTNGLIFPDIFIPMLSKMGQETELFRLVLKNVLVDISEGRIKCGVSINVTQSDTVMPGFVDYLLDQCNFYNVEPSLITLELTEHGVYEESVEMITNMARLRLYGFGISIDDFGVGSSSYLKLSHLPFTEIKIDKDFVFGCIGNETKMSIIKSMCTLAKNMHIKLVSEGVEDDITWKAMQELGVDVCQGYYTGKPMPIEALDLAG